LGEIYEREGATAQAAAVYADIASFSTNAEWRSIAQQKVKELGGVVQEEKRRRK
jgi:hypothetical protein